MRRAFIFFVCLLSFHLGASTPSLVTEGKIHPAFVGFCKNRSASAPDLSAPATIWNQWAQAHLLRAKGLDHQDLVAAPPLTDKKDREYLQKLGLVEALIPVEKTFTKILIFGGTPWETYERIEHLQNLVKSGFSAEAIVYINGRRPLARIENLHTLEELEKISLGVLPLPVFAFQHEMAEWLWNHLVTDAALRKKFSVLTLDPPKDAKGNVIRRINTGDTVTSIFAVSMPTDRLLFISNNPYGPYQSATVFQELAKVPAAKRPLVRTSYSAERFPRPLAVYSDTLARWLFTLIAMP